MPNTVMLLIMQKSGFTLIELLITITIAGILLLATIPTMRDLIAANRATAQTEHIVSALQFARSEAIKRDITVQYCGSSDHKTCDGDWDKGQIITTINGELIRVFPALPYGDKLELNSSLGHDKILKFTPLGTTNSQSGRFCYTTNTNQHIIQIIISAGGRIKIEKSLECPFEI